jgi:uncharacterized lipoprotein YajG
MKRKLLSEIAMVAMAAMLAGCAQPPPQQFVMQRPDEQKPQTITFPNGRRSAAHRAARRARSRSSSSTPTITT